MAKKESKIQTGVRFSQETLDYINAYRQEMNLTSFTAALEKIVMEHRNSSMHPYEQISDLVIEKFERKYGNAITRIRLGTNTSDINSQIMIEMLNAFALAHIFDIPEFTPSSQLKSDLLEKSEKSVRSKIAYYKQRKDNNKNKSQKEEN